MELTALTSEGGLYVLPTVPAGVYVVSVEKAGFKKSSKSGVEVRIATRQELNLQLEVGAVQQSVEVTANAQLLETTSSARGPLLEVL